MVTGLKRKAVEKKERQFVYEYKFMGGRLMQREQSLSDKVPSNI